MVRYGYIGWKVMDVSGRKCFYSVDIREGVKLEKPQNGISITGYGTCLGFGAVLSAFCRQFSLGWQ